MPTLLLYLVKLSCSLMAVYLFYHLVLRRLTFYNANRWYLLGYSLLCFFIPFVNISSFIDQHQLNGSGVVQRIPVLETYTSASKIGGQHTGAVPLGIWDYCQLVFLLGAIVLLARLVVQYFSLRHLQKRAQLLTADGIKIFQVDKNLIPFSFGNAIFINQHLHSETELKEIIRHEFVHVKQRHTIDIFWTEVLCILNWYNPAAWAIRHAVRQNLEFIADNNVLQSGLDKREYQYLLLKVMGLPQFRIATPFNFSSLKKRIVMMNKLKSAKAHLVKFLFMLPLLAVLLVAFRNATDKPTAAKDVSFTVSGLVIDAVTQAPLANVAVHEIHSNAIATSDNRGFFTIAIPINQNPLQTEMWFSKEGFEKIPSSTIITTQKPAGAIGTIEIIGMVQQGAKKSKAFVRSYALSGDNPSISTAPTYAEVLKKFEQNEDKLYSEIRLVDTVPTAPAPPDVELPEAIELPDDYKDFMARNPEVAGIQWSKRELIIQLKSGKKETYLRNDAKSMAEAKKKWGALPTTPPPPPPPPVVMPPKDPDITDLSESTNAPKEIQRLKMQIAKLTDSLQSRQFFETQKDLQAYMNEKSVALQRELRAKQSYLQQQQLQDLQEQKASLQRILVSKAASSKEQEALLLRLKEQQNGFQKQQKSMIIDKTIQSKEQAQQQKPQQTDFGQLLPKKKVQQKKPASFGTLSKPDNTKHRP